MSDGWELSLLLSSTSLEQPPCLSWPVSPNSDPVGHDGDSRHPHDRVLGEISLAVLSGFDHRLKGVQPVSLALAPDLRALYVALAGVNAVGVVDLRGSARLVGLIPTVRGIRKRSDIKINLEHLSHLVKAASWLSSLDIPVRLIAFPEGALQAFNDEVLDLDHATFARECAIDIPGEETEELGKIAK